MRDMEKLQRLEKLAWLVQRVGGSVEGRKKLHKLVYLCQQKGLDLGQDFIFHEYGVYSPGLAEDLQQAATWDVLREEPVNTGGMTRYRISLGGEFHPVTLENDAPFLPELAQESPSVLEVLGTIVFLKGNGHEGAELRERLRDLKGHLENHFDRAFELAAVHFGIGA